MGKSLSAETLRSLLSFCAETGEFYWKSESRCGFKKSVLCHSAGDRAGTPRKDGRIVIRVEGKLYLRYRLAWLYVYGQWPDQELDHINGNSSDDRMENLRDVPRGINQQNLRKAYKNKTSSSLLGVYTNKGRPKKPWRSSLHIDGREKYLGAFATEQEAQEAYLSAKRKHHEGCTI
jgi:hypothetical protein